VQVHNTRAARDSEKGMENAVEMVVKVMSQGQAVPKDRPGC